MRRPKPDIENAGFSRNWLPPRVRSAVRDDDAPDHVCSRQSETISQASLSSAVGRGLLIRDAVDRAFVRARGRTGHRLDHFARTFGIGDPILVEIVGAGRDATRAFAR